ncbi:MAG TPA: hypothetical protein VKM72_25590 [Thermoanaerobaculia bacterium]|nr:hypothetical protein [Thermoanaerobaculia bacterium]
MAIDQKYRDVVRNATLAAGAAGIPGAFSFGADVTAMAATWGTMIVAIAKRSNHRVDPAFAAKLASGVLTGVAGYVTGSKIATTAMSLIPGGVLLAVGVNSGLNSLFTYRLGLALSKLFDKGKLDASDATTAVTTLLSLMIGLPTWGQLRDFGSLLTEG